MKVGPLVLNLNSHTVMSKLMIALKKLKVFNRLGVVFWGLISIPGPIFYAYFLTKMTMPPIIFYLGLGANVVNGCYLLLLPFSLYQLEKQAAELLWSKTLNAPNYRIILCMISLIKLAIVARCVVSAFTPPFNAVEVMLGNLYYFVTDVVYICPTLLLVGSVISTLIAMCEDVTTAVEGTTGRVEKSRIALQRYRALHEGCQTILFVLLASHTVLVITNGYIIKIISTNCVVASYSKERMIVGLSMQLITYLLVICFLATLTDDCYAKLQNVTESLR